MRTLLKLVILAAICLGVFGFFRGWFTLSSAGRDENNKVDIRLTVDTDKAKEDARKAKEEAIKLGSEAKEKLTADKK